MKTQETPWAQVQQTKGRKAVWIIFTKQFISNCKQWNITHFLSHYFQPMRSGLIEPEFVTLTESVCLEAAGLSLSSSFFTVTLKTKKQKTGIFSDFQQMSFTKTQSHVECTRFMTVSFDSEKAQALILLFSSVTTCWDSGFSPEVFPSPRACFPKTHHWHQQPAFVNPSSAAGQVGKSRKRLLFCSLAGRPGPAAPSNPEEGNMKKKQAANQILYLLL